MKYKFLSDESGNSIIEYALIISFVALVSIPGISALHHSLIASLETMVEPDRDQKSYIVDVVVVSPQSIAATSLSSKLADLRKKKGNQGLAIGHIIGNGANKPEGEEKFNKDEILAIIDEEKEKHNKGQYSE